VELGKNLVAILKTLKIFKLKVEKSINFINFILGVKNVEKNWTQVLKKRFNVRLI